MKKKVEIKKTMTLDEVLNLNPNAEGILMGFGMHCLGCPCSRAETLEEASMVHGFDVQLLIDKLNEIMK
ncbi:MAG: DUF1858 domain-containing protein [Christensenellales bacterium]